MTPRFDIGIVGGGPAGSAAAISLALRGYSVCLMDKSVFPRTKLCGDFLNPVNWPLLLRLGVAEKILTLPHEKVAAFRISTPTGSEAFSPFPSQPGRPGFGLGLSRLELDDLLIRRAQNTGARVLQGARVAGIQREEGGWAIALAQPEGVRTVHAAFLIGADGRNSLVAQRLKLDIRPKGRTGFIGLQLRLKNVAGLQGEVQIHLFPGGYAGLVGLGNGEANLCLTLGADRLKHQGPMGAVLKNRFRENPRLYRILGENDGKREIHSIYPVHYPRRRPFGEGFLLIGDAAFAPEPVTGEGIYFALASGELACETAHRAFSAGDLSARQTASYEAAWKRRLARRRHINRLIGNLMYHPNLLAPLIALSAGVSFPIRPLVRSVLSTGPLETHAGERERRPGLDS